jgi:hypothetical protein
MRGSLGLVASIVALAQLVACHSHVELAAPPRSAPVAERLGAYARLRATGYQQTQIVTVGRFGVTGVSRSTDFLQLSSGERVYYAEDILPVVGPDSPAGLAAAASLSARETASIFNVIAIAASTVGLGGMLASLAFVGEDDDTAIAVLLVGGSLAIVGSLLLIPAMIFQSDATDEATSAYETYNLSLAGFLGLCERGDQAVDCNAPAVAPVQVAPPPTNACVPGCRSGFTCVGGACISACNPPCAAGTECVGDANTAQCAPTSLPPGPIGEPNVL